MSNQSESGGQTGRATTTTPTTSTSSPSVRGRASESVSTEKPHGLDLGWEASRSDDQVEHPPDGRVNGRDMGGSSMGHGAEQKLRPCVTRSRERRVRTEDRASGEANVPLRRSSRTHRLPAHLRDYHVEMHK